ncbi:hypothetical protein MASR2M78_29580 [Treponema sp.]
MALFSTGSLFPSMGGFCIKDPAVLATAPTKIPIARNVRGRSPPLSLKRKGAINFGHEEGAKAKAHDDEASNKAFFSTNDEVATGVT